MNVLICRLLNFGNTVLSAEARISVKESWGTSDTIHSGVKMHTS